MPPRSMAVTELRVAIDTGGTFTDCVWVDGGRVRVLKVFSTPADPSHAIVEAVKRIVSELPQSATSETRGGSAAPVRVLLLHGTTVGTNSLLERKGARVAFVTTAGFEDSIEIGRQARPRLYDFFFERVAPLVDAEMRFGVPERTSANGEVLKRPSAAELDHVASAVAAAKPDSVAISLLFPFANAENERAVSAALANVTDAPQSLSHVILPEFREYERASTVVVNAYLQPVMQRYLGSLEFELNAMKSNGDGTTRPLASIFVMQSSGGITSLASAAREPVRTVLSGPAGGVVGAFAMGRRSGFEQVIGFDMGGTSTDVALVAGEPRASSEAEVAGLPVRVPMLDIHTVGAGGGSIARFDAAGALRVGPESAGADPGPICYGRGEHPTVTDANLLLGRLRPEQFLGGDFTPDLERTRRVVGEWLRRQRSALTLEQLAAGVVRVVNATMEKALRVVSIERGYDARNFALVAFGGAGGMHACELAVSLGVPRVIVPPLPGALSAYGILVSDVVKDYSRTVLTAGSESRRQTNATDSMDREFSRLERAATADFRAEGWRGKAEFQRTADLRYRGQGFELNVPFGRDLLNAFHGEHQRRYGYSHPQREVEVVTLRLRGRLKAPPLPIERSVRALAETPPRRERVWFDGKFVNAAIYNRAALSTGKNHAGPAVITEYSATTVVPPGMRFYVDRSGAVIVETKRPNLR